MTTQAHTGQIRTGDDPRSRQGQARMRVIAAETAVEIERLMAELLQDLNRTPTATDKIIVEQIASAVTRGRRLRRQGKDDAATRQQIAQLVRASGFKPAAPAAPKSSFESPLEYARRVAAERAAAAAADSEAAQ